MGTIFANGPSIDPILVIIALQNLVVYPFLKILQIQIKTGFKRSHLILTNTLFHWIENKCLCTSHLYPRPPPTGIAVEWLGYGAVQVLFDCPHSAGEVRGL